MSDTSDYAKTYTEIDTDDGFFSHLSWGAVFGGLAIAIAVQVILTLIGVSVGMAAANPYRFHGHDHSTAIGIGEGLWYLISTLLAIFAGAAVAARLAGAVLHSDGVLHGLVTWAVSLIAALFLLSSAAGGLAGGPLYGVGHGMDWGHHNNEDNRSSDQNDEMDHAMAGSSATMNADQTKMDLHMQMGRLAANPNDTEAQSRASADLQNQGLSATDANNRLTQWKQKVQQDEANATKAISLGAAWAALSLILGAAAAAFGGLLGSRWASESVGLDLYPETK